jgi:threonine aldolase
VTRLICAGEHAQPLRRRVLTPAYVDAVGALAQAHGLRLHVDGARLWNAAVALGEPPGAAGGRGRQRQRLL